MIRSRCQNILFITIGLILLALPAVAADTPLPSVDGASPTGATTTASMPTSLVAQSHGRQIGDTVAIDGTGFEPGETVSMLISSGDASGNAGPEYDSFEITAGQDGTINAEWVISNPETVWQPLLFTATGANSSQTASTLLSEIGSRITITSKPSVVMRDSSFEVSVFLEEDCCDSCWTPLEGRLIEFYIHDELCGVPIGGTPIATAVTDANGIATATLIYYEVGQFTLGVKYWGEDQPGENDPANSACFPGERVKILASIDCTYLEIIHHPVLISCPPGELGDFFVCAGETVCMQTDLFHEGAGGLVFSLAPGSPGTIDPVTGEFCITPDSSGIYGVTVIATDSIGQTDDCNAEFSIEMNSAPVVALGDDMLLGPCYPKEICLPVDVLDVDQNITTVTTNMGTLAEGEVCITINDAGVYELIVEATDECGELHADTLVITADEGELPYVDLGEDFARFLCEPTPICVDVTTIEIYQSLTTSLGTFNPETGQVCIDIDQAGPYEVIVAVTDTCGRIVTDTVVFTVTMNQAPVVIASADTTVFPCYPQSICLPVSIEDADGNIIEITSSLGTVGEGLVCLDIPEAGSYEVVIVATDDCGETATDTVVITADPGVEPFVTLPADFDTLLCGGETICIDVTTIAGYGSVTTNLGSYDPSTGQICFTPEGDGLYSLVVEVTDTCGNTASDDIDINVTMNKAPTITAVLDTSFYLCFPQAICLPVTINDADNNIADISTSLGYYDNGLICFTPYSSGTYEIEVTVTDDCGETATTTISLTIMTDQDIAIECPSDTSLAVCVKDTICIPLLGIPESEDITVDIWGLNAWYDAANHSVCFFTECSNQSTIEIMVNTPCSTYTCEFTVSVECNVDPLVLLPPDTTLMLCEADSICLPVGISDVNNNLAEISVTGGTYDPTTGLVCFLPDTAGTYKITVIAFDDCGAEAWDEIYATVEFNEAPVCDVPNDTSIFYCGTEDFSLPVSGMDVDGNLTGCTIKSGPGQLVDGMWTYTPTGDETVTVTIQCTDECGATCESSFTVSFDKNQPPAVACVDFLEPVFVCDLTTEICINGFGAIDEDGNLDTMWVTVDGVDYPVVEGSICFVPTAGSNDMFLYAVDDCGDTSWCDARVEVVVNSAPTCLLPTDTTLFICEPTELCFDLVADDSDGNLTGWELISGPGAINGDQWCYDATTSEIVTMTIRGSDSCGAYCEKTFSVTIEANQAPEVFCPEYSDPIFVCDLSELCLDGFLVSDLNGNLDSVVVTVNAIVTPWNQGQVCFTPQEGLNHITFSALDSCGAVSRCETMIMVVLNSQPTCTVPNDTTIFQCDLSEVSLPVSGYDIDGNLVGCTVIDGPGLIVDGMWTYTPTGDETITVTVRCEDECGATCESSFTVTFDQNQPPTIACVDFLEPVFVCDLNSEICVNGFVSIDEDDNLVSEWVTIDGVDYPVEDFSVCFVPTEGTNTMYYYVVDACDDTSWCDAVVEVVLNSAPTCLMPTDTTLFNCGPVELCLDLVADDSDGNLSGWELISGPGSIVEGSWCYTPEGTETVTVTTRALDSCGAYCDQTFTVTFELNSPPELTFPDDTTISACNNSVICIGDFLVVDPDDNLETVIATVNGDTVAMTGATICFNPIDGDNILSVVATDACGAVSSCETIVTVNVNEPPVCDPPNDTTIVLCEPEEICLPFSAFDPDGNFDHCEVVSGNGEIIDGFWCFTPDKTIGGLITVRCFDSCGAYCETEFTVNIEINEPPIISDRYMSAALCEIGQIREIAPSSYDPDGDPLTYVLLDGPGTINSENGVITYYPDTSGIYTFEVAAYDTCAGDTGFVYDTISINTPPELTTFDSTIQVCNISEVCFEVIGSDPDGDVITITQESGLGVFTILTDSSGQTCFMPEDVDSATYVFTYCVTDPCTGAKITSENCPDCPPCEPDTIRITVLRNRPPVVVCPEPQQFSICEPQTLCFDFDPGDLPVSILSGNAVYDNGTICFDANGSDQFDIVIEVVDDCDASDTCIVPVTIEGNHTPSVTSADDFERFLCEPSEICFDVAISDPDQDSLTVTTNIGTYNPDTDQVCFFADTAGRYDIVVTATDSCGASASDTTTVFIDMNDAPYVDAGADFEIGLCGLTQVCFDLIVGDDDHNIVTILSNLGAYDPYTGKVCFDVEYDGVYELIVEVTDECGATAVDTVHITVTSGAPPFVDLGADLDLGQCEPREVCVDVITIDTFESLTTTLGVYNESTSQICFTPEGAGEYTMIVTVVDSCDQSAADTVNILIGTNRPPIATGMPDSTVYLCFPQTICLPIDISDPDGNIQTINVTGGSYSNGQVCFTPYDSGTFEIIATVTDSCGEFDADTAYVTIRTDQGIQIVCPNDTTIFTCVGDTFCLPIGGIPDLAEVNVTGINTWFDDELQSICFYSECGNTNEVTVEVTTPCGTHSCSFTVVIECNHDPLVLLPPDTSLMFCGSSEVCVPVGVTDPDGNLVEVNVEGGLYDPLRGQVCFTADTAGAYTLVVTATDECGEQDSDSITVTVEFNTPPVIIYEWADSVIATCVPEICVPISFGDAEDNLVEVLTDVGYYNEDTGEICFVAETSGEYCVEVIAIDECGLADTLSACVTVDVGEYVQISCPDDILQAEPICGPESVCVPLEIIGNNYTILTSIGSYAEGQLCFQADSAGLYEITVIGTADCNSDTCVVAVEVTIPDAATVVCPADTAQLFCGPDTLCFAFTVSAAVTNVTVSEPAYLFEGMVCVPVLEAGATEVTMIASSNCNADTCSFTVTATFNSPPTVVTGPDTTLTVCEPYEVCIPFTTNDPDDNIIEISSTHGVVGENEICFTPDGFGIHEVIVSVRDACGEAAYDTTFVNILSGGSPLIVCPSTTVFDTLCAPDSICITMPISPTGALVTISPNGSYDPETGAICVYVDQTGLYNIMVTAEAQCGIDTCEFDLDVLIPQSAEVTCPSNIDTLLCLTDPVEVCYPVAASGTDIEISVSSPAVYLDGQVCILIEEPGTYEVTVIATGRCDADTCTTTINVTGDQAPELFLPEETFTFVRCIDDTTLICIDGIYATDIEGAFTLTQACGPGDFELVTDDSGQVCFLPDAFGLFEFCFEVDDGCSITGGSFWVDIEERPDCDVCVRMSINSYECTPVGLLKTVDLMIEAREWLGGFDVLLAYDASVMAFTFATIEGTAVEGWEYFEYRIGAADCGTSCPSGLIRFVGIADINNGPHHPPSESRLPNGVLVRMQYQVANDQNLGDQFLPINFAWYSCADNAFSDTSGNDLFVDVRILNPEGAMLWDELDDDNYPEESRPFGMGTRDECFGGGKTDPIRCVEFINGGICVIHPDSIDDRGDINLNGVPYEIADAVVFSNYFIHGLVVFVENLAGQIAATDVNADGVTLSVADLVLLIRVIVGDADPIPKLTPYDEDLIVSTEYLDGRLRISTDAVSDIGAAYFVFDVAPGTEIEPPSLADAAGDMDLMYRVVDGELRVLILDFGTDRIKAGKNQLIEIPFLGENAPTLKSQEIVDYLGRPYNSVGKGGTLPTKHTLSQNYPNPFNPATTISFSTPQATAWTLQIYNVTGALVRSFAGHAGAGHQSITWDGRDTNGSASASGVYFYRLDAGSFSDTKKMVLLK